MSFRGSAGASEVLHTAADAAREADEDEE